MSMHQVPPGVSGYRGVHAAGNKGWRAVIEISGIRHHLGYFASTSEAAAAYDKAAVNAWGDFAVVNFKRTGWSVA